MSKSQINFRLPDTLIAALKDRAESEGITSTELAIRLLEAGLGLPSKELVATDESRIEERIEERIAPLREQVTQLNQCIELRILAALQKELDPLLGEPSRLREKTKFLRQKPQRQTIALDSEVTDHHAALGNGEETQSRKELGKLFNVSHEAIRIWEESGKLLTLGWERIPHIKSPVKYSRKVPTSRPSPAKNTPLN